MVKITEKDFNVITGKETITEREETAAEIIAREAIEAQLNAQREAESQAEVKRNEVLAKLGLTAEEAQALLG